MTETAKSRVLARLSGEDDRARRALVRAALDHALGLRLRDLVDPPSLAGLVRAAVRGENVRWAAAAHIRPGLARQRERSLGLGEIVGDLLPGDADAHLGRILDGARLPDTRWAETLVDRRLVNKLVAPVVQETLLSFAKRLPLPGVGGDSKASARFGALAGSAGKLFDVGKSLVGGLSAEVERRMREVAKDFAENVGDHLKGAIRGRLESDEGRRLLREIALDTLARIRKVPVADLLRDLDALPAAEVDALLAAVADHNASREALVEAVRAEIGAGLLAEGDQTLGALLERGGVRAEVEAVIAARADVVLREFFASAGFAEVIDLLFDE